MSILRKKSIAIDFNTKVRYFISSFGIQSTILITILTLYCSADAESFEDVLIKEAVYAALSHSASEFRNAKDENDQPLINYRQFLSHHLLLEAFSSDAR